MHANSPDRGTWPVIEPDDHDELSGSGDDDHLRGLVARLARPHPSGGKVIERAAILAAGTESTAILNWIVRHSGVPEELAPKGAGHGLHGTRLDDRRGAATRKPLRYVLPPGALQ
jgi:hypothetical protein